MKTHDEFAQHGEVFRQMLEKWGVKNLGGIEMMRALASTKKLMELVAYNNLQVKGLSVPRIRLLLWLYAEEGQGNAQGVSPSHLSHFQHVSKNTTSSLLRSLEEQGLIERTLSDTDKRRFEIRLSPAGRDIVRATLPNYSQALADTLTSLNSKEQETLIQLLHKLRQSLRDKASANECSPHKE